MFLQVRPPHCVYIFKVFIQILDLVIQSTRVPTSNVPLCQRTFFNTPVAPPTPPAPLTPPAARPVARPVARVRATPATRVTEAMRSELEKLLSIVSKAVSMALISHPSTTAHRCRLVPEEEGEEKGEEEGEETPVLEHVHNTHSTHHITSHSTPHITACSTGQASSLLLHVRCCPSH